VVKVAAGAEASETPADSKHGSNYCYSPAVIFTQPPSKKMRQIEKCRTFDDTFDTAVITKIANE